MFIVVSQQQEFYRKWMHVLERRGHTRHINGLAEVQPLLHGQPAKLMILDFRLIQTNPLASLQNLRRQCGAARVLLGETSFEPQRELAALAAGVVACCDAALQNDDMERIIDTVMQGGVWVSRATIPLLVAKFQEYSVRNDTDVPLSGSDPLHELTQRQREVAEMVSQGANNKQIANTLNVTERTVKAHLTTIFEKLEVHDRLHLALYINSHNKAATTKLPASPTFPAEPRRIL